MKFIIIDAKKKECRVEKYEEFHDAVRAAGLDPSATDHGQFARGIAYVVYEYGHFVPKETQNYCRVGNTLISGNLVVYAYNEMGDTIAITDELFKSFIPNVAFFKDHHEVETAIKRGIVRRPQMTSGDEVLWKWPESAPEGSMR